MAGTTLNKLVYDLKNTLAGGTQSDDIDISDRQIAYWIAQTRALLIRQEFSNRGKINDAWIQHSIIEFEKVNNSIDPNCSPACCDDVYRSICTIPTTIQRGHNNGIISVLSVDKQTHYSETSYFRAAWHTASKYTAKQGRWYIQGDHLYIIGKKPTKLMVSALYEDPELAPACDCDTSDCFTWDSDYPITMELAGRVSEIILKKMSLSKSESKDIVNNAVNTENEQ